MAMSGGIDSSVSAVLLHDQGYEVVGITMKTWDYVSSGSSKKETGCCSLDSINDARSIAVSMGFPHYILDIREEFGQHVIDNFVDEYLAGRTPNPCVRCNTHIKWEALLKRADMLDCEFIATGHYAKVRRHDNGRYVVSKGLDAWKDQSYVLWGVKQECLSRTLFPVGGFEKPAIRRMAAEMGFHELANKPESYEICFIPDNDYRGFLKRKMPASFAKLAHGKLVDTDGTVLGEHDGYPFFTIGQRKGLGIATGTPLYVTDIRPDTNTVVLGGKHDLLKQTAWVREPNFQKIPALIGEMEAITRIRYKDKGTPSTISMANGADGRTGQHVKVEFHAPVGGIAPGQSAVFYEGNDLLGGGFIDREPAHP